MCLAFERSTVRWLPSSRPALGFPNRMDEERRRAAPLRATAAFACERVSRSRGRDARKGRDAGVQAALSRVPPGPLNLDGQDG
jgi:hypothetical protein